MMNIILLSGGSGKRLWPLSNDVRSKQFIKIFKKPEAAQQCNAGEGNSSSIREQDPDDYAENIYESMLQRVFRQIRTVDPEASVTIATARSQVSAIRNQIGEEVGISVEPCRRDTFPAIALATAYLHDVKGIAKDEAVVVCPVDPYVTEDYFTGLKRLWELAQTGIANLVLMGIQPTYPSEKYGYIIPVTQESVSKVSTFKEKPAAAAAQVYIEQGGLWNGGVFAYKLSYVLERARQLIDFTDYADLFSKYDTLEKISFDYAVAEHEPDIAVMRFNGEWKDLGTWNTLTEAMEESVIGDVRLNETCRNVHAINELGIPVLAMGLRDVVISASPEGILVSDKEQSSYIKPFVDEINGRAMFGEKSWGSFRILDVEENSLTIKVTLNPGHRMNYHSHERRNEVWTVISGQGRTIVDGMEQPVKAGDVITMEAGCRHTVIADTMLQLIEVQLGNHISVSDKHKYELGL